MMTVTAAQRAAAEARGDKLRAEFNAQMDALLTPRSHMKTCITCGIEKDSTEFFVRPDSRDGRASRCMECARAYTARQKSRRHRKKT